MAAPCASTRTAVSWCRTARSPGNCSLEHQTEWVADLTGVSGYVRLFVHDGGRRGGRPIAVLDPPMANLRLVPPPPQVPQVQW